MSTLPWNIYKLRLGKHVYPVSALTLKIIYMYNMRRTEVRDGWRPGCCPWERRDHERSHIASSRCLRSLEWKYYNRLLSRFLLNLQLVNMLLWYKCGPLFGVLLILSPSLRISSWLLTWNDFHGNRIVRLTAYHFRFSERSSKVEYNGIRWNYITTLEHRNSTRLTYWVV